MTETPAAEPMVRVVSGDPTAEELAALVAVLASRAAQHDAAGPAPRPSAWSAPASRMRPALRPGPDGWRRSALPR